MKKAIVLLAMVLTVGGLSACGKSGVEEGQTPGETVEADESGLEGNAQADGQDGGKELGTPGDSGETEGTTGAEEGQETGNGQGTGESGEADSRLDNFDVDMEKVAAYATSIQEAVASKDLEKLADLTGFPVYVGLEGVDVVETREDFLALDPEAVFSEEMVSSIEKADISALEPSMAGFTLMEDVGAPGITFSMVNGELRIVGINY